MADYTQSPLLAGLHGLVPQPPADVQGHLCAQLATALDQYYVHLPQKRAAFAIDPVREVQLLRASNRANFTRRLIGVIASLRDRHTTVKLSQPWTSLIAYVPFILDRFLEGGRPRYVVTKQLFGFDAVPVGAEVTHWNGKQIDRYVGEQMLDNQGANAGAQLRLAIANLSVKPLSFLLMPNEDWVTLNYIDPHGSFCVVTTPWRFYSLATAQAGAATVNRGDALAGLDEVSNLTTIFKDAAQTRNNLTTMPLQVELDGRLRYSTLTYGTAQAGYIRLTTFDVPDAGVFVRRMADILANLPQDRLVIDLRGNPGGFIPAGQKFIRLLTKNNLAPSPIAFRNTASTLAFGALPMFAPWAPSLDIQWDTGEAFSQALPVTTYEDVPPYRYPGRIALIVDGLCYSTTDFFAADFRDNGVGRIIGIDAATGGGGANVWGWSLLAQLAGSTGLEPLPPGYDMNLAMRRSLRTGPAAGIPVEDLGVPVDVVYAMTRADVLYSNRDLLSFAVTYLDRNC